MSVGTINSVSTYRNTNGKTVYRCEIRAETYRDALNAIPGDFKVYWHYQDHDQDRDTFAIEIVRTF